ncbi:pseudouridine synthase [Xylariales sp. PMI_506]|nr:pseudouridine synthase [Xylariales sp. PMI_506]
MATHTAMTQGNDPEMRSGLERNVGILHFVSPKEHGWNGVLRKRFTDFQVHEIGEDGKVLHLHDFATNAKEYDRQQESFQYPHSGQTDTTQALQEHAKVDNKPKSSATTNVDGPGVVAKTLDSLNEGNTSLPKDKRESHDETINESDTKILNELLGEATTDELLAMHVKLCEDPKSNTQALGKVAFPQISDKDTRKRIHSEVRRIFSSKIETISDSAGIISAQAMTRVGKQRSRGLHNRDRQNQQNGDQKQKGKYLHFSLYKENKDTMEAISHMARMLKMTPNMFGTAGTKDRRAVTVQRVSIRSRDPRRITHINDKITGVKIGDFEFSNKNIFLGSHNGNEFNIVLKDCVFQGTETESFNRRMEIAQSTIDSALATIHKGGFINYFGTQRFGTFEVGTHILGLKILKGDFKGAVQDLLSFDSALTEIDTSASPTGEFVRYDDIARAKALSRYKETGDAKEAISSLPRRCTTELAMLKYLDGQPTAWIGAILSISRTLRSMYLHAYQSLVWNFAASRRWELFGANLVKGDLVFARADSLTKPDVQPADEDDEENIHLRGADVGTEEPQQRVHVLTDEDLKEGQYSIHDVVLPSPGTNVIYPDNEIGEYYKEFMGREENGSLDPYNMQRRQREFSLTGAYRKFMGSFIGTPTGSVRSYTHDNDQLIPTDVDLIMAKRKEKAQENQRRKAENMQEDLPEARISDTWVQTSLDGSKKRIKVASQETDVDDKTGAIGDVDVMDIDQEHSLLIDGPAKDTTPELASAPGEQLSGIENKAQIKAEEYLASDGSRTTHSMGVEVAVNNTARNPLQNMNAEDKQDKVPRVSDQADTVYGGAVSSTHLTREVLSDTSSNAATPIGNEMPEKSQTDPKIAVILKFALHPSSYATIALRELQG